MTLVTLVCGARASLREAAIAEAIDPNCSTALILEGLPDGTSTLDSLAKPTHASHHAPDVRIARIAPGCLCCTGNLTMRVTLNRILRQPPARLFISLATATHLERIRSFLQQTPYDELLVLTTDIQV